MSKHPSDSGLWLGFWSDWMDGQQKALEAGGYPQDYFADEATGGDVAERAAEASEEKRDD